MKIFARDWRYFMAHMHLLTNALLAYGNEVK